MSFFTDQDPLPFSAGYSACPRARTISYNIAGPISALGFNSTTLAQLMSRYATSEVQPLIKGKLHPWLLLQLPKKKRTSKNFLLRLTYFPS
jgi:hypothetical protein